MNETTQDIKDTIAFKFLLACDPEFPDKTLNPSMTVGELAAEVLHSIYDSKRYKEEMAEEEKAKEQKGPEWEWHQGTGEPFVIPEGQEWGVRSGPHDCGIVPRGLVPGLIAYKSNLQYRRVK